MDRDKKLLDRKIFDRKILAQFQKAKRAFLARDYGASLQIYNDLLLQNLEQSFERRAKIGVLLSDIAMENEEQAQKLFEYHQILRLQKIKDCDENILHIIELFDKNANHFAELICDFESAKINDIDGILYSDFKQFAHGDFRKAFECAMFSTKIIFTNKDDFIEFLENLVENDFSDISLQYIEGLDGASFYDERVQNILKKALENLKEKR